MKIVIFGLSVSSSWGNGHATLWRGLCSALARRGHKVVFFEKDVPWYASARDLTELPAGGELILYQEWRDVLPLARLCMSDADTGIVTSYCPDALSASDLLLESKAARVFYDLDAPVTLARIAVGETVDYVGPEGYRPFELVLSYAGGKTLAELRRVLGAARVLPLYGSVDPEVHKPGPGKPDFEAGLSYMGTYSADRDKALETLFIEPARRLPDRRFVMGGSAYNNDFPWLPNIFFVGHLTPADHSFFYCSSGITLNVTRGPMAAMGYCPSARLFEAAACGVPVLSDHWEGLDAFYQPGSEILVGRSTEDAIEALSRPSAELAQIGRNARERTLACHTAVHRAAELVGILEKLQSGSLDAAPEADAEASAVCGA